METILGVHRGEVDLRSSRSQTPGATSEYAHARPTSAANPEI